MNASRPLTGPRCRTPVNPSRNDAKKNSKQKGKQHDYRTQGCLYPHHFTDRRQLRTGRSPVDQAMERRARLGADHAATASQWAALLRHQCSGPVGFCHGAELRRTDLGHLPPGLRAGRAGPSGRKRLSGRVRQQHHPHRA